MKNVITILLITACIGFGCSNQTPTEPEAQTEIFTGERKTPSEHITVTITGDIEAAEIEYYIGDLMHPSQIMALPWQKTFLVGKLTPYSFSAFCDDCHAVIEIKIETAETPPVLINRALTDAWNPRLMAGGKIF